MPSKTCSLISRESIEIHNDLIDALASFKIYIKWWNEDGEWAKIKPICYINFNLLLKENGFITTDENNNLVDWEGKSPDLDLLRYLADPRDKEDKVFDNQMLIRMPVVRNGKQATVGYCPEIWKTWE